MTKDETSRIRTQRHPGWMGGDSDLSLETANTGEAFRPVQRSKSEGVISRLFLVQCYVSSIATKSYILVVTNMRFFD